MVKALLAESMEKMSLEGDVHDVPAPSRCSNSMVWLFVWPMAVVSKLKASGVHVLMTWMPSLAEQMALPARRNRVWRNRGRWG